MQLDSFNFGCRNSTVNFGNFPEPVTVCRRQCSCIESPRPVARGAVRKVHAALVSEAEQILQGHDRRVGHRRQRGANKIPMDFAAVCVEIFTAEFSFRIDLRFGSSRAGAVGHTGSEDKRLPHGDARSVDAGLATGRRGRPSHETPAREMGRARHCLRTLATHQAVDDPS